ncbi:NADH:ubiquinone oxidoreductase 21kD subunit [Cadophora gregata]|uniref:NADH:ubiquinone oxidoreductase 21kD subunit n=1 Tax=Cadophora gregata TaxID=51156 RepID=UPI0026DCB8D4|nr:NADH:ubiquinone oxidoreductase 21kD subunit [Cadophora gregata]KAK0119607.1 NADH:ubiquinone oxidoreductase 21kD subunit [Cadophora gregata]KAK0120642.1 NADH:ubiquinone oxidoreductase 21kD subunit [Cadophora gregata f. sp. sojae]
MSLLRPSIAGRLLRAGTPCVRRSVPGAVRFESQTALGTPLTSSTPLATQKTIEVERIEVKHNQPEYTAEVDHASSQFSPVPKRVMNGSEAGEVLSAAVLSGAPIELEARTVRIYRPTKPATQSGDWHGHHWRMDWDILSKGHRWENPLMGWQSSADFMQGTHLTFKSREDAIRFAEKQGYEYFVQEPNVRKTAPKAYANNFLWSDKKLKHIRTK